jgi:hypothetical protein
MYQTLAVVCHGTNPSQGSSRFEKQNANWEINENL